MDKKWNRPKTERTPDRGHTRRLLNLPNNNPASQPCCISASGEKCQEDSCNGGCVASRYLLVVEWLGLTIFTLDSLFCV